jgi:hypothetical protein
MPYYLTEVVQAGPRSKVVRGAEEPGANWILLDRDRVLLWLPSPVTETARLQKFADDADEQIAVAGRSIMGTFAGRTLANKTIRQTIVDLLRTPEESRWGALSKPSKVRQQYEIWLGPGGAGRNLFWSQPAIIGPNSKTFVDNFNRTAGDLDGSTSSDGNFTWDEIDGTTWTTNGTQADFSPGFIETFATAQAAADLDTDDHYSQTVLSGWTRVDSTLVATVIVRFSGGGGYSFDVEQNASGFKRVVKRYDNDAPVVQDTTSTTSGTLRLEADGNSLTAKVDGGVALGPSTNTQFTGQLRCGIGGYVGLHNGNSFQFDDYECGDLVAVVPKSRPLFPKSARSWKR